MPRFARWLAAWLGGAPAPLPPAPDDRYYFAPRSPFDSNMYCVVVAVRGEWVQYTHTREDGTRYEGAVATTSSEVSHFLATWKRLP